MTTGQRMKARRKEIGLSAEYVAAQLGISPATVYRYENGGIDKIPIDSLGPIAKALQTSPAYLMGWSTSGSDDDDALLYAISADEESGRSHAKEEIFRLFGTKHSIGATRIVDDGLAVLYYHAFQDRNMGTTVFNILDLLNEATRADLDAIHGIIVGYLRRDRIDELK